MKLPSHLIHQSEWTLVGPMGPELETSLLTHSLLGVDGGARFTSKMDVWIGDQDSFVEEPNASCIFKHGPNKNMSDLALALSLFQGNNSYRLHLWGFLGGRKDHELFNLGEVSHFLETHAGSEVTFYDAFGKKSFYFMGKGKWEINHHGLFSLGALKETSVEMSGNCDYPLKSSLTALSSLGLSNFARGKVYLINESPVFFYFPEGK